MVFFDISTIGRERRSNYFCFHSICLTILTVIRFELDKTDRFTYLDVFGLVYGFYYFIVGVACTIRRLHDTNRSAWYLIWFLIPGIGVFPLIYSFVLKIM